MTFRKISALMAKEICRKHGVTPDEVNTKHNGKFKLRNDVFLIVSSAFGPSLSFNLMSYNDMTGDKDIDDAIGINHAGQVEETVQVKRLLFVAMDTTPVVNPHGLIKVETLPDGSKIARNVKMNGAEYDFTMSPNGRLMFRESSQGDTKKLIDIGFAPLTRSDVYRTVERVKAAFR